MREKCLANKPEAIGNFLKLKLPSTWRSTYISRWMDAMDVPSNCCEQNFFKRPQGIF